MRETWQFGRWEIPILGEDNHLLLVEKPPNLIVQADRTGDEDLLSILKAYIGYKYEKPGNVYLGLVHRLDRPVGGAMVFARTSKAAARLAEGFRSHTEVKKTYLAIVRGAVQERMQPVDYLLKDAETGMVRVVTPETAGAKRAELISEPLDFRQGHTLMRVTLLTGRAHQIRVQHACHGYPIWGDARYGGGQPGQQIALWSYRLEFMHPTKKTPLTVVSTPPQTGAWRWFADWLEERD